VQLSVPARQIRSYPHEMSGGMRQRVLGAIAMGCKPSLLLADEPTTALDVTVQAQYLRLLRQIQKETGLGMIFVTHDFGIVAKVCDHVAVMYAGRIVETATTRELFDHPLHPYSTALIDCLPQRNLDKRLRTIPGHPPDLSELPPGCGFAPRCSLVQDRCCAEVPSLVEVAPGHRVACWCAEGCG
jgi:oligopeptide/dipeptide ABC transporter ATP-binding protein